MFKQRPRRQEAYSSRVQHTGEEPPRPDRRQRRKSPTSSEEGADSQHSDPASSPPEPEHDINMRYRRKGPFSWRNEICRFLDVSPDALDDDVIKAMDKASQVLKEAEQMKAAYEARLGPPRYEIHHAVRCEQYRMENKVYLDEPWVVEAGPNNAHLRGSQDVSNLELHLERNKEVVFIVYKNYRCCGEQSGGPFENPHESDVKIEANSLLNAEYIWIISPELKSALEEFAEIALAGFPHPNFGEDEAMRYPYIWWFHRRAQIDETFEEYHLSAWSQMVDVIRKYVLERMAEEWKTVDELLARNAISLQYMNYLFIPDQIAISTEQGRGVSKLQGVITRDWYDQSPSIESPSEIDVTYWTFDGTFHKASREVSIKGPLVKTLTMVEEFNITDLSLYPIQYASDGVIDALRNRGKMFWKCRFRNYCALVEEESEGLENSIGSRFMVDLETYKKLHPDSDTLTKRPPSSGSNSLDNSYMSEESPELGDDFFICLPTSIFGFNMDNRTWDNLDVHFLRDVVWNTEAFKLLVVPDQTKLLVQAVVMNQLRSTESADIIPGKGNGLFILLHGGPGTGKTLTAESVAEIAKKPLYRVTCGDIGTKVEEVEDYLHVVLHLGKTWGCVVLLDEADVFLEQRSMFNLERNALVSVFLRVLEYYDGIIILTTNRVGILVEAFKSRIQLNLRYENLGPEQRSQIWRNFFQRLQKLETSSTRDHSDPLLGADVKGMMEKVDELAKVELNGRQIRNTVSTARQLARYLQEPLSYEHLSKVIDEAKKFDEYLLEVNQFHSADKMRRDLGER